MFRRSQTSKTEEDSMGNQKYLSVRFAIKGQLYSYFTQKHFKWSLELNKTIRHLTFFYVLTQKKWSIQSHRF